VIKQITVEDWLIVSIGDSVASGEGNPDVKQGEPGGPKWKSKPCHRSQWAGPSRAALLLESENRKTTVTFVHVACSGATVNEGLLGDYAGIDPRKGLVFPPQVQVVKHIIQGRTIDALLVSIGANDVKFGTIVDKCFRGECLKEGDYNVTEAFQEKIDDKVLEKRYAKLASCLSNTGVACPLPTGSLNLPPSRVFLVEYLNPTLNKDGVTYCTASAYGGLAYISSSEFKWAGETVLTHINGELAKAAATHGWTLVGGISKMFERHGYCADDLRWVVTLQDSDRVQDDQNGTMHPNRTGHHATGVRIAKAVGPTLPDA
jgi:hypothetical protein